MKLTTLVLTILLYPLFASTQNAPECDSVVIDCCVFTSPTLNTVNIQVSNYSSNIFSYPGFVLLSDNMDTVAKETVNYFGIGWDQTHILNIIHPFNLPFEGILELHTGFFESHVCTFPITILDTTTTAIQQVKNELVTIYPNPTHDQISIAFDHSNLVHHIQIANLYGSTLVELNNTVDDPINISHLQAGVYFAQLFYKDGTFTQTKFIKK